jgi:hypothetical protein
MVVYVHFCIILEMASSDDFKAIEIEMTGMSEGHSNMDDTNTLPDCDSEESDLDKEIPHNHIEGIHKGTEEVDIGQVLYNYLFIIQV